MFRYVWVYLLISCCITYAQFEEANDKICVKESAKSGIDGTYEWSYWNPDINASAYYNSDTNISIYPFIKTDGSYSYYIGENISSTSALVRAYCTIGNDTYTSHTSSYIFNTNNCVRKWKIATRSHTESREFVRDPNMYVTNCADRCVSGNNYSAVDGIYVFSHFDFSINGSVYYCNSCGVFLYPFVRDNIFYWCVGPDYSGSRSWSHCNLGNKSSGYIFNLDDCIGNWQSYISTQSQWVPSAVLTGKCNYTDDQPDEGDVLGSVSEVSYIYLGILIMMMICVFLKKFKSSRKRKEKVTWDVVFDFNDIRSSFKSKESLQVYLFQQRWCTEMVVSVIVLIISIFINTYTNVHSFLRYRHDYFTDSSEYSSFFILFVSFLWENGLAFMAIIECYLSAVFISYAFVWYILSDYKTSVSLIVGSAPCISAMIYFIFLDVEIAKYFICQAWDSKKTLGGKICNTVVWLCIVALFMLVGVAIFVIKIQQITYIYDRDLDTLGRSDFIVVFGVARQFAGLYKFGSKPFFGWALDAIHPEKIKALKKADHEWDEKNNIDEIVCREMVEQYGLWGYLWLCYTFNSEDNVKKLYLKQDVEQSVIAITDQTGYVQMVDHDAT